MKHGSLKTYCCLFCGVVLALSAGVCIGSYLFMEDLRLLLPITLLAGSSVLLTIAFTGIVYWKMDSFSSAICQAIDRMMNDDEMPKVHYGETLQDKIIHRLVRLYEMLEESKYQALSDRQALQQLISDISHQVKTPIASLLMINSTLLERDVSPEKQTEFLLSEQAQLVKLEFLIEALVKTSRLESGMLQMQMEQHPISATIAQALGSVVFEAEQKNINIAVCCDESLLVTHDRKWTTEAVYNILQNAVKYTEAGGQIKVDVSSGEMHTKIVISDTGRGIPEELLNDIFKRFYRGPDTSSIPGIGVGLYLAREIITMQNGYIVAASRPGAGASFSIYFPNQ